MDAHVGERFARALAAKDATTLLELLDPEVDFRALTPGTFWEATNAEELVHDILLGQWFEPTDRIEAVEHIEQGIVVDRHKLSYRFRIANADGAHAVEQQAYFEVSDGRISWLRIMCSGYRQVDQLTG